MTEQMKDGPPQVDLSDLPLYVQVREALRRQIAAMQPGEAIETETQLGQRFRVSRITVRKAIDDLVSEGLLVRRQGRGTFVRDRKLTHRLDEISSWTEQLVALGYTPGTDRLKVDEVVPPAEIAEALKLGPGEAAPRLSRVRLADGAPITLMVNYLHPRYVTNLAAAMEGHESLYEALAAAYRIVPYKAVDRVETRVATEAEAKLLRIAPGDPVLVVTRTGYLENGEPYEVAVATSRGDRYQYEVTLHRMPRRG